MSRKRIDGAASELSNGPGRLLGEGLGFTEASGKLGNPTLEGAAAIAVFGAAAAALRRLGAVEATEFPLMRHLYEVVVEERPLAIPWASFFGGEPPRGTPTEAG